MSTRVKVLVEILLSVETFKGRYHQGGTEEKKWSIAQPITILDLNGVLQWVQERDRSGNTDTQRLPGRGVVKIDGTDAVLYDMIGQIVLRLVNFTTPATSLRGPAEYKFMTPKSYGSTQDSETRWVGKGTWKILDDDSVPDVPVFVSGWRFVTSSGTSAGLFVAEGAAGSIVLQAPSNQTLQLQFAGGGASLNADKFVKILSILKNTGWLTKLVTNATAAIGRGAKQLELAAEVRRGSSAASVVRGLHGRSVTGGASDEAMFSTGLVLKTPLVMRELEPGDFTGPCVWLDASAGVGPIAGGGMLLLTGFFDWKNLFAPKAVIPCAGHINTIVSFGAGVCVGYISR